MKRVLVCSIVAIFFSFAQYAFAGTKEVHEILPTGNFPDDVYNVQSVVDDLGFRGVDGKIVLAALNDEGTPTAFNFGEGDYVLGERSFVLIWGDENSGDIAFVGETVGSAQTTIVGGFLSIYCARSTKFEVKGIRFEGAEGTPIMVSHCNSCEIKDNEIVDVRGDPFGMGPYGVPKAVGIWVASNYGALDDIEGYVEIKDNRIYDVVADYAFGIAVVITNAAFEIKDNEIFNINSVGILISDNQKPVIVEKNLVIPGPGNTLSPFSEGTGIHANFQAPFPLGDDATLHIEKNRIICENPNASGIGAFGGPIQPIKNSVFTKNHITMVDTLWSGIDLGVWGGPGFYDNYIGENVIDGKGTWAIYLGEFWPGALPSELFNNTFEENNLDDYLSAGPDVIFDEFTHNNFYFGGIETVLDLGQDNVIVLSENDD